MPTVIMSPRRAAARGPGRAPLLALAAGAGLAAAMLAYLVLARRLSDTLVPPPVAVVVAAQDLPPRQPLTAAMLTVRQVPPSAAPAGAVGAAAGLIGQVTTQAVAAGQPVTRAAVAARDSLPGLALAIRPRRRAVSVPLDAAAGDPGFLEPGDHVDVLATFDAGGGQAVTHTVLQDARLLAIGGRTEATPPGAATADKPATAATLEVTPGAAQALALASARGRLQLTLRGLDDDAEQPIPDLPSAPMTGKSVPAPAMPVTRAVPVPPMPVAWRDTTAPRRPRPAPTPPAPRITVIRGSQATTVTVGE